MTLALALLARAGGGLLALLARIPPIAWLVLALLGWGTWQHHLVVVQREAAAAAVLAAAHADTALSEKNRTTEAALAVKNLEIANALSQADAARVAAAADVAVRLRAAAHAKPASAPGAAAAAACQSYAGVPVDVVPDAARERLVAIARDADEVADHLRACQAYVHEVLDGH